MTQTLPLSDATDTAGRRASRSGRSRRSSSTYPLYFLLVPAVFYGVFFALPTLLSFYYSFTRWDLFTAQWIGLDN